jgi:hypothetical protein
MPPVPYAKTSRVRLAQLAAAYNGPVPPAALAAARWGRGAWQRLARGADGALIEARLRAALRALGRLRSAAAGTAAKEPRLEQLARAVAQYRGAALAACAAAV